MTPNQLKFYFRATNVNGYPTVRVSLDDKILYDFKISCDEFALTVDVAHSASLHTLTIERYGKDHTNCIDDQDQILEIISIDLDNIPLPMNVINKHTRFEFNDQCHPGSCYFGPNGTWTFEFSSPIITWVLDQKILHESHYSQDYKFPWSYQLGPNTAKELQQELENVTQLVNKIL